MLSFSPFLLDLYLIQHSFLLDSKVVASSVLSIGDFPFKPESSPSHLYRGASLLKTFGASLLKTFGAKRETFLRNGD